MLGKQQLMSLFAALSDAISAHDNAKTRIEGVEQQKPKKIDAANYIVYEELEAASAWQERMDTAISELTAAEADLGRIQQEVLTNLPETVKKRLEQNVPVIIGEGNKFIGLYQRGKELAVLTDQHDQTLYGKIYSYYQQGSRKDEGIQGMMNSMFSQ